jgi:hypothetical protein
MTRQKTFAVTELPFYLRNQVEADLVALALEGEADRLAESNNGEPPLSSTMRAAIAATVDAYRNGATATREFAKRVAQPERKSVERRTPATSNLVGEAVEGER